MRSVEISCLSAFGCILSAASIAAIPIDEDFQFMYTKNGYICVFDDIYAVFQAGQPANIRHVTLAFQADAGVTGLSNLD